MAWKDELQPASFRGVPFHVDADSGAGGRRGTLHEYPLRDTPLFEDMGRKGRERSFTAFVIGAEFIAARDALLEALEAPGPGELVHPTMGRLMVSVPDFRYSHSKAEGGMCRFEISFVESGELRYPSARVATGQQTIAAAEVLEESSIGAFEDVFNVAGLPAWASLDAVTAASDMLDTLQTSLGSVGGVLGSPTDVLIDMLPDLIGEPFELGNRVFGLFSKAGAVITTASRFVQGYSDADSLNYSRAFTTLRLASSFGPVSRPAKLTATRKRVLDNRDALNALTRRALLMQAAGMTGVMPLPVYDDAVRLRDETMAALDDESMTADDTTYLALVDLRAKVYDDMTSRIANAARLREIRPPEVLPALALSYDLYESLDREGEIIARNRLRHPGFVPAEPLKVLSE